MHGYINKKKSKQRTQQRRMARSLKSAGLVELAVNREIELSESYIFVAELTGGAR